MQATQRHWLDVQVEAWFCRQRRRNPDSGQVLSFHGRNSLTLRPMSLDFGVNKGLDINQTLACPLKLGYFKWDKFTRTWECTKRRAYPLEKEVGTAKILEHDEKQYLAGKEASRAQECLMIWPSPSEGQFLHPIYEKDTIDLQDEVKQSTLLQMATVLRLILYPLPCYASVPVSYTDKRFGQAFDLGDLSGQQRRNQLKLDSSETVLSVSHLLLSSTFCLLSKSNLPRLIRNHQKTDREVLRQIPG